MANKSILIEELRRGRVIAGTFEVQGKIGEGGCGSVYRCKHLKKPDKTVALKVLDQPDDAQRFAREGKVLRQANHANVVKLFGKGMIEGRPYLAMEYIGGGSVRDLLKSRRKMSVQEAAWLLVQTVRGLRAANTVHRDLKPENLLIEGGRRTTTIRVGAAGLAGTCVKVADFGLAKSVGGADSLNLTHSHQVMGTPVYMSPEQCKSSKRVSFKTDVYAIGIILFEMINGKVPFDGTNVYDIMTAQCEQDVPWPKRMPAAARAICERCLEKKPTRRYPSLAALERDLARLAGVPSEVGGRTKAWLIWLMILCLLLAVAGFVVWYFRGSYPDIWHRWMPEALW